MIKRFIKFAQILTLTAGCFLLANCSFGSAKSKPKETAANTNAQSSKNYREPRRIAEIQDDAVRESSGLVASRKNLGVLWTHNDSGDGAFLYAFDKTGKKLGVWKVAGASNTDWEDIAIYTDPTTNESYLLIGDIGNNQRARREVVVYKVIEPKISAEDSVSNKKSPRTTAAAAKIRLEYSDAPSDVETLLVNPSNGDIYLVSKNLSEEADVYKAAAPYSTDKKNPLQNVGKFSAPSLTKGFFTGGEISPDGKRLIICDYFAAYEAVLPAGAKNFDEIWKTNPEQVDLGERAQGEAICYSADGKAIYATSEKRPAPLIEVVRR